MNKFHLICIKFKKKINFFIKYVSDFFIHKIIFLIDYS